MKKKILVFLVAIILVITTTLAIAQTAEDTAEGGAKDGVSVEKLKIKAISNDRFVFKLLSSDVIEIGVETHSPAIPYVKLNKWDGEVSLKINVPYVMGDELDKFEDNKLKWSNNEYDVTFYPKEPEEIKEIDSKGDERTFTINDDGGVEFDLILREKPETNVFTYPIETKNLTYYYQPPLNQEKQEKGVTCTETECKDREGNIVTYRPENVVGSYAVYHESKAGDYTKLGGKNYRTGKAFHIYRPRVYDANGNWIWGELNIDEEKGVLTVIVDQNWLDNANYPVVIDPNFGFTSVGASAEVFIPNAAFGSQVNPIASVSGDVDSVSFYGYVSSGSLNCKGFVTDSSLNILTNGITPPITASSVGNYTWNTITYSTKPSVSSGNTYYPFVIASNNIFLKYDSETDGCWFDGSNSFASPSDPTDAITYTYKFSIYATYTASAAAPSVTTNAATPVEETTATLNGNVTDDGGAAITERGFYCDTNENPSTKYVVSGTTGAYTKDLAGLSASTKYYFKAFAANSEGTSYGDILNFTTLAAANNAPTISSVTGSPNSLEVGNDITFSVDWNDADAEGIKMYICKAADGGTSGCGAGGTWCSNSNDYDLADPITCSYTTQSGDVGSQNYYAYVCDNEPECSSPTSGTFTVTTPAPPSPCEDHNVYGWAWSENIGWISFSCRNRNNVGEGVDYGVDVDVDETTGIFSGYAWAGGGKDFDGSPVATIGWISFGDFDGDGDIDANDKNIAGSPCAPNCEATLDLVSYEVSGWARALAHGDDWDGWIKLRGIAQNGDPYGVSFNSGTNEFEGWAWAGNDSSEEAVIGWISFNCQDGGYVEEHFPSITGEASDGFISAYSSSYSTAHSTSDSFSITGSTLRVGQEYNEAGVGECTGTAYDCGLSWWARDNCELKSGCTWVACEGTAATCDSWDYNYGGCLGHDGCYWDGCTGTATDCDYFWSWTSCTGQDGCEWIESGYGDYCDGTPDSCDSYGNGVVGEFVCNGQDGCSWDGCSGTATSCDSYDDDWASGLKWDCEAHYGCSWPGCIGTPDPCDSFGSESDCNSQPGCSWDEGEDEEFGINRGYLDFDTSSIPDGATITDVKLSLKASQDKSDTNFDIEIYKFNWAEPITSGNREANYDAVGAVYDKDWRNTSGMSTGVYYDSPSLDNSWVNKTGDTKYQLRSSRDVNESGPYGDEYIEFYSADSAGNKPILKVTYTIEAAPAGEHYDVCGDSDYKVESTLNQSPYKPTGLYETWGCCGGIPQVALRTCLILNWSYLDPDGDLQAGYEVWVDETSDFSSPKFNHEVYPGSAPFYTVDLAADDDPPDPGGDWFSKLDWGTTYHWKVKVKDSNGNLSDFSDPESFTMPNRASPNVDFTPNPVNPRTEEEITFIDESKCYLFDDSEYDCDTGGDEITYEWDFDYDGSFDPSDWTKGDTTYTYPEAGNYTVRLQITDTGVGGPFTGMCSEEVAVGFPLPTWREVTPF